MKKLLLLTSLLSMNAFSNCIELEHPLEINEGHIIHTAVQIYENENNFKEVFVNSIDVNYICEEESFQELIAFYTYSNGDELLNCESNIAINKKDRSKITVESHCEF